MLIDRGRKRLQDAQLDVGELEAQDVGHDQDGVLSAAVFRVDFIGADWRCELRSAVRGIRNVYTIANVLDLAFRGAVVLDADRAALLRRMRSHVEIPVLAGQYKKG